MIDTRRTTHVVRVTRIVLFEKWPNTTMRSMHFMHVKYKCSISQKPRENGRHNGYLDREWTTRAEILTTREKILITRTKILMTRAEVLTQIGDECLIADTNDSMTELYFFTVSEFTFWRIRLIRQLFTHMFEEIRKILTLINAPAWLIKNANYEPVPPIDWSWSTPGSTTCATGPHTGCTTSVLICSGTCCHERNLSN